VDSPEDLRRLSLMPLHVGITPEDIVKLCHVVA
jgi:hypothetical protein